MTRAPVDSGRFWAGVEKAAADLEHKRNLHGKTTARCQFCGGKGHTAPSRTDYDAHGSYYVPPDYCYACSQTGRVEVACSAEVEATAVQREIDKLKARMRELKRRARKAKT